MSILLQWNSLVVDKTTVAQATFAFTSLNFSGGGFEFDNLILKHLLIVICY